MDPLDAVALVARSRREQLLAIHHRRLSREDLEDCYSQATLELLVGIRRGGHFYSRSHIANVLEQRLISRVRDRHRAVNGRSPIESAIAGALSLLECEASGIQIPDARVDLERLVIQRELLRQVAALFAELSPDQRLVLSSQLEQKLDCAEFCRLHDWSTEKYRKVAQRARIRLGRLLAQGNRVKET